MSDLQRAAFFIERAQADLNRIIREAFLAGNAGPDHVQQLWALLEEMRHYGEKLVERTVVEAQTAGFVQ